MKGACVMYTKEMFDALLEKMKDELEDVKELEVEIGIHLHAFFTNGYKTYETEEEMEEELSDRKWQMYLDWELLGDMADELGLPFDGVYDKFSGNVSVWG